MVSQQLAGLSDKANWFSTELGMEDEEEREQCAHPPHLPMPKTPSNRFLAQLQKLLFDIYWGARRYFSAEKVGVS